MLAFLLIATALQVSSGTPPGPALRAPRLVSPAEDARVPPSIEFEWAPVAGASGYAFEAGAEGSRAVISQSSESSHVAIGLPMDGPVWWRVRAVDARGTPGPWSSLRRIRVLPPPEAPSLFGLTVNPSRAGGGENVDVLLTLTDPAPAGGASVALSSNNPEKAAVPRRALFREGETTVTVGIHTEAVSSDTQVEISAHARANSQKTMLTLAPPGAPPAELLSLAVLPARIAAGAKAIGTVTLTRAAPARGFEVKLASADASRAAVPARVVVPPGATATNFAVQAGRETIESAVTITALSEGSTQTAEVRIGSAATAAALAAPGLVSPSAGSRVARYAPVVFEWSPDMHAVTYTIELDDGGDFQAPLVVNRTVPEYRVTITPLPRGPLWWRVRANDANGAPGAWSAVGTLNVD